MRTRGDPKLNIDKAASRVDGELLRRAEALFDQRAPQKRYRSSWDSASASSRSAPQKRSYDSWQQWGARA